MRRSIPFFVLTALLALATPSLGQGPVPASVIDSLQSAGAEAGTHASKHASVGLATWGSAAITVVLGPLGGVGAILLLHPPLSSGAARTPDLGHASQQLAFEAAYQEAYRATYRKRFRWAVVRSALIVSAVQAAGFLLISGG